MIMSRTQVLQLREAPDYEYSLLKKNYARINSFFNYDDIFGTFEIRISRKRTEANTFLLKVHVTWNIHSECDI